MVRPCLQILYSWNPEQLYPIRDRFLQRQLRHSTRTYSTDGLWRRILMKATCMKDSTRLRQILICMLYSVLSCAIIQSSSSTLPILRLPCCSQRALHMERLRYMQDRHLYTTQVPAMPRNGVNSVNGHRRSYL